MQQLKIIIFDQSEGWKNTGSRKNHIAIHCIKSNGFLFSFFILSDKKLADSSR